MGLTISRTGGDYQHTYSDGTVKGFFGRRCKIGMNSNFANYWSQSLAFINVVKHGYRWSLNSPSPGTEDANGYIDASTSGNYRIYIIGDEWFEPGTWVLEWDESGGGSPTVDAAVTFSDGTLTFDGPNEGSPVNRREYLITQSDIDSFNNENLQVVGYATNIVFMHEDQESRYDAGNILHSQFVSDMSPFSCWRLMDWGGTNNNYIRDTTDLLPYTYISWAYDRRNQAGNAYTATSNGGAGVPPRAMAEAVVELDIDAWLNIPHQAKDATVTAFCQEFWDNLTTDWKSNHKIYVEYTNEWWQSGSSAAFADQARWIELLDGDIREATCVPATATCTDTSHGLSDGDEVRCFNNIENIDWPFARGGQRWAIVDDANTWRLSEQPETVTNITQANPGVVTTSADHGFSNGDTVRLYGVVGMTEVNGNDYTVANATATTFELSGTDTTGFTAYTSDGGAMVDSTEKGAAPDDSVILVRYIPTASSSNAKAENFAAQCVVVWDLAEAVFGSNLIRLGTGRFNSSADIELVLAATSGPAWASDVDYVAIANYFSFSAANYPMTNYENATDADLTNFILSDRWPNFNVPELDDHVAALGHHRFVAYEGGLAGVDSTKTAEQEQVHIDYSENTTEVSRLYNEMYGNLAEYGFHLACHYVSHGPKTNDSNEYIYWGALEFLGDTAEPKYAALKEMADNGGAAIP